MWFLGLFASSLRPLAGQLWPEKIGREIRKAPKFLLWSSHNPPAQRSLGWDPFHFLLQERIAGVDINTNSWVQHLNCKSVTFTSNINQAGHSKINYNFASKYSTVAHTAPAALTPQCIMSRIGAVSQSKEKCHPGWHCKINSHRLELLHQYS